jgi:hypothetical protein
MHVARQRYLVTPAGLTRPKGSDPQFFLETIIIKILNKKLKIKNPKLPSKNRLNYNDVPLSKELVSEQ